MIGSCSYITLISMWYFQFIKGYLKEKDMGQCPKCKRVFKRKNQSHYWGEKPTTIDEYIARQEKEIQPLLIELKDIINKAIPEAKATIAWGMPTWKNNDNIIHFAVNKNDISLYPGKEAVLFFHDHLSDYKVHNGVIKILFTQPLPEKLITKIAKWCYLQDINQE